MYSANRLCAKPAMAMLVSIYVRCSGHPNATDWKLIPQGRLRAALERDATARGDREIVTVLGNRMAESASRGVAMLVRAESAISPTRDANNALAISPLRLVGG
jgi:hypothetical protein